ncbi:DUF4215 domain-containing protein [Nannocystis punicea]|uniref:DUF4215 domain-containing protein n=1 Tax=Nannocystis punicea TaxID=2995304 RepID=A0ABY7H287_9BACT|nr:DUF4215 domain-containing protein [Nannocystis poenicansa]WAS93129.1 DUF4215 domain-containing protein [Nannocystis poenicansa]
MTRAPVRLGLLCLLGSLSCLKSDFPSADDPRWKCNEDFVCDPDENQVACPSDCVWSDATGEGPAAAVCDAQENWTFVSACLDTCGNGQEDEGETRETCPRDFPGPGCGDGVCAPSEDPARCPTECHAGSCGDGTCDLHENAAVCADDCEPDCGDGTCQAGEETTCPRDCEPCGDESCVCGDMECGPGESMTSCPQDCTEPTCGNGAKEGSEPCDDGNAVDTDACTNSCKAATCGDGIVWVGEEECDDGPENGPGKPCSASCESSSCGDGEVGPGEACDDGNDDDTDACVGCQMAECGDGKVWSGEETCDDGNTIDTDDCTNACEIADCGDGIVHEGAEECDDGNQNDTDSCSNLCAKPRRVIFVTNTMFQGDLDGLDGADLKCQAAAMAAQLTNAGTFKAWLSDAITWPAQRMDTSYQGRYILVDGTPIAENGWDDLTDGTLSHAIDQTELQTPVNTAPWTNVKADGTNAGTFLCNKWESPDGAFQGHYGLTSATDARWTDAKFTNSCNNAAPLYCIEDP